MHCHLKHVLYRPSHHEDVQCCSCRYYLLFLLSTAPVPYSGTEHQILRLVSPSWVCLLYDAHRLMVCTGRSSATPKMCFCYVQQLAERHVGMLSELERRMEEERQAMKREAAAMAASGEDRARAVLSARSALYWSCGKGWFCAHGCCCSSDIHSFFQLSALLACKTKSCI